MKRLYLILTLLFFIIFTSNADSLSGLRLIFDTYSTDILYDYYGVHDFTGLMMTSDGWTDFETLIQSGYEDARVVFVSSSNGNDSTADIYTINELTFDSDGMFQPAEDINAFATIAAANSNMRSGYPDILLLKRGDDWDEGFNSGSSGRVRSGRSSTERQIVASYGLGDRPQLHNNSAIGFDNDDASYIIVSGIRFYADDWLSSSRAIDVRGYSTDILFENLKVDRHRQGIFQGGDLHRMVVRRCIFTEHEAHDGMFYASSTKELLFEENLFYKPHDDSYPDESRFGRTFYLNPGDGVNLHKLDVTVRRNILFEAEREGLDARAGGLIDNNLFIRANLRFGAIGGSEGSLVSGDITNNVFTQGSSNIGVASNLLVRNAENTVISNNIWLDPTGATSSACAITLTGDTNVDVYVARNIEISSNLIYGWNIPGSESRSIWFASDLNSATEGDISDILIQDNHVQQVTGSTVLMSITSSVIPETIFIGNRYFSSADADEWFLPGGDYAGWLASTGETGSTINKITYNNPLRTVGTYNEFLGGDDSTDDFIDEVLEQSRQNWRMEYTAAAANNYFRDGFNKDSISP